MGKDAYYFKHLSNARNDPKHIAMVKDHGVRGYGIYWMFVEILREDARYKFEDKDYNWIGFSEVTRCPIDELKNFIGECVTKYDLISRDDNFFYSMTMLRAMSEIDLLRDKKRQAAETRWAKQDAL